MSFDLASLDTKKAAEAGAKIYLDNPFTLEPMFDDEKQGYYIEILGGDSGKVSDALRKIADKRLERIQKNRTIIVDSAVGRQEDIETLATATLRWHLPPIDGEDWDALCDYEHAKMLYGDLRFPWIMEQLEKAIGDRKRFFKGNSTT